MVASAAAGLFAPIAAQASQTFNIDGLKDYSRGDSKSKRIDSKTFINKLDENLAVLKSRVDGLEARQSNYEAGSFSDTTTMDGKAVFTIGAADYDLSTETASEAVKAFYSYTMNLNSSFTGDDNLYVRIKSGNGGDFTTSTTYGGYLSSAKGNGDDVKIDKIWYQFPLGENNTVWVGPKIENYYMHGTTPSLYKPVTKQFTLGGNGYAYGASTDTGAGWAYRADNGFAISSNVGTKSLTSCKTTTEPCGSSGSYLKTGLLTDETKTSWATQVGYTKPNYSASIILNQKYNGWSDSYFKAGDVDGDAAARRNATAIGLRGWWRPEQSGTATPSISVGYDTVSFDGATANQDEASMYFVGLNWTDMFQADDKIGLAFGQPTTNENLEGADPFAYELYYSFKPNDSVTVTPAIFGGSDRTGTAGADVFGTVLETTFKF